MVGSMSLDNEVHGQELETFTVCAPRPGAPARDGLAGVPMLSWDLSPSAADELERSIRVLSHDVRRGRPFIYRGPRRLLPERLEEDEDRELLVARSTAKDPAEADAVVEVVGLRGLRRELISDIEARRRELADLERRRDEVRGLLAKEEELQRKRIAEAHSHGQEAVKKAQDHYDARLQAVWSLEAKMEQRTSDGMMRIGEHMDMVGAAKKQVDRMLRAQTAGEVFAQVKGVVEAVGSSPIGQAMQTSFAAKMAAIVSNSMSKVGVGTPIDKDDALMAIILQGAQFRTRRGLLLEMEAATPPGNYRAKAMVMGVGFCVGDADPRAIADFIGKGND